MTLQEAIAEVKDTSGLVPWDIACDAAVVILNAVASGDLLPKADAEQAVAVAYQRAADAVPIGPAYDTRATPLERGRSLGFADARQEAKAVILALAPADALAEVQALKAAVADGSFYKEADIDALMNRAEEGWSMWDQERDLRLAAEAEVQALRAERDVWMQAATNHANWQQAAEAEVARLRALVRRVVNDPVWRTNDNTLWPDLCAALRPAQGGAPKKSSNEQKDGGQ